MKTKSRPKIKDVAKMVGVSSALVSLVLNDRPYVSKKAKEKIFAAIEKLGYRPNIVARSLRKKR